MSSLGTLREQCLETITERHPTEFQPGALVASVCLFRSDWAPKTLKPWFWGCMTEDRKTARELNASVEGLAFLRSYPSVSMGYMYAVNAITALALIALIHRSL